MNQKLINNLISDGNIAAEIETSITLKINGNVFRPGTVRIHLPAPINASWLKEGQLLDSEPMFRMASVEDYPQRSVYFNERLEENTPFSVKYAFISSHKYTVPNIELIDSTVQKTFTPDEVKRFSSSHHCGCESYTALPSDAVSILDVIEDKGIAFKLEYADFLKECKRDPQIYGQKTGTMANAIYNFITEHFNKFNRNDHNITFVSMCRMCGIPARWQGGWAVSETKVNKSGNIVENTPYAASSHDWAMVHLQPYGWIYVDCKFGADSYEKSLFCSEIPLHNFFFGNIDPCMVPTASVPGADLYPAKDYERADKMFNVYGEVELVPDKLGSEGHFEGYGLSLKDYETKLSLTVIS